jgi:hypothetical protein
MMLQIDHRESHDVDLFLSDPQFLPFLDPQKHDFELELSPSDCNSDGAGFLKLAFEDLGEIDFIVSGAKTSNPTIQREIEGERTLLETIPEIIAKKIIYRGAGLKARDIFDIAAAAEKHAESIAAELRSYKAEVATALEALNRLNPEFVNSAISQLQIRAEFDTVAKTAIERTKNVLQAV